MMPPHRSRSHSHEAHVPISSYLPPEHGGRTTGGTEGLLKRADEGDWKLRDRITRLEELNRRAIDEYTVLWQSFKREQEDKAATRRSLRREEYEKGRAVSRNERLIVELDGLRRRLDHKDAELRHVRNTLQHREESLKEAGEEIRKLKEEVGQLRASRQRAVDESTTPSQSLKDKVPTQWLPRREKDETGKVHLQNQRLTGELSGLRHQIESKDAELNNLRNTLQQSQIKHGELAALLETRSRELKGAQVYLTKADTLSGAEVIGLVNALNVEILQTSAFISDSFDFARKPACAEEMRVAAARMREFLGPTLAGLISTVSHGDSTLLVQIALQSATVELSCRIITTWDFDDPQARQPLVKLYNGIRETETQAVGGRWRALTRAHALRAALQEGKLHATMVARISDTLVAILVAAGCTRSYNQTYRIFTQNFGEHISNIVKMALRLNKTVGEEVTSADLRPVNVTSGEKFDEATMVNFELRGEDTKGQAVLCTTALGIQRSEKVVREGVFEFRTTTLLKPKVAVESVVGAVDGVTR